MKKLISIVLSLILILTIVPITGAAATEYKEGNYTYTVTDGLATIVDFPETVSGEVKIPSKLGGYKVTKIGDSAFYACTTLTKITIPSTVVSIGSYAFGFCIELETLIIPSSVTSIGNKAFNICNSLENIYFGGSEEQWADIISDRVDGVTIHYNYSDDVTISFVKEKYEVIVGEEFAISGDVKCGESISQLDLVWQNSNPRGLDIKLPASELTISETELIFSALATAKMPGEYTVTVSDSNTGKKESIKVIAKCKVAERLFDVNVDYYTTHWNSSSYNANLANLLCALSADVYNEEKIKKAYKTLGFETSEVYDYDGTFNSASCGYSLAFKKSDFNDDVICLVTVRGSSNVSDWVGNVALATFEDEKHIGFAYPANRIYNNIRRQIAITGNVKFVITGHSRGAAVSNLLAVKLAENGVSKNNIYSYNFACPDVACKVIFPSYNNIFNLCNREDPVPFVPGNIASTFTTPGTHWDKFGKTYWFTKDAKGTLSPFADHNINLYLEFFDNKKNPSDWGTSFADRVDDAADWASGWITKILCPVDVRITDDSGKLIASVIDGEVNYYDSEFGRVIILTDGDRKVIYTDGSKDIHIDLIGTDTGTMTYSIERYNLMSGESTEVKTFRDVKLELGKTMYSSVGSDESADEIELLVVEKEDGNNVITHVINTDGSEESFDCSCNCHARGLKALFFKIVLFFQRLFGLNSECACGKAHY